MVAEFRTETSKQIVNRISKWSALREGVSESSPGQVRITPPCAQEGSAQAGHVPAEIARKVLAQLRDARDRLDAAVANGAEPFDPSVRFCNQTRTTAILLFVLRAWIDAFRSEWIDEFATLSRNGAKSIATVAGFCPDQQKRCEGYVANILGRAERLEEPSSDWGIVLSTFRLVETKASRHRTEDELRRAVDEIKRGGTREEVRALSHELLLRGHFAEVEQWLAGVDLPTHRLLQMSIGHIAPFLFGTRHPLKMKEQPSPCHFDLLVAAMELGNLAGELMGEKGPLKLAFRSLISEVSHLAERLEIMAERSAVQFARRNVAPRLSELADRLRATVEAPLALWQRKHESHPSPTAAALQLEKQALEGIRGEIADAAELLAQSAFYAAVTNESLETIIASYDALAAPIEEGRETVSIELQRVGEDGEVRRLAGSYRLDDLERAGISLSHDGPVKFRCQVVSREALKGGGQHMVLLPWRERELTEQRRSEIRRAVEAALSGER